jgi:hypothetical protein
VTAILRDTTEQGIGDLEDEVAFFVGDVTKVECFAPRISYEITPRLAVSSLKL